MKYEIFRHQNDIVLNPREYIQDGSGNVMLFDSVEDALTFINAHIATPVADADELEEEYGLYIAEHEEDAS